MLLGEFGLYRRDLLLWAIVAVRGQTGYRAHESVQHHRLFRSEIRNSPPTGPLKSAVCYLEPTMSLPSFSRKFCYSEAGDKNGNVTQITIVIEINKIKTNICFKKVSSTENVYRSDNFRRVEI